VPGGFPGISHQAPKEEFCRTEDTEGTEGSWVKRLDTKGRTLTFTSSVRCPLFRHRDCSSRIDPAVPLINSQRPPCPPCDALFQHRDWSSRINPAVPLIYSPRPSVSSVRCPSSDTQRGVQGSAWPIPRMHRWNPRKILCVLRVLRVLRAKSPLPTLSPECRDRRGRCTDAPMDPQTSSVWWFSSPAKGEILPRQSACCLLSCLPGCYVLEARANTC
jgi:hypothetical protein